MTRRLDLFAVLSLTGVVVLALQLALPVLVSGRQVDDESALRAAEAAYDLGVERASRDNDGGGGDGGDADAARTHFLESADAFARAGGAEPSAALLYNRANALLRAGRVGEAIADYRAAQSRAPGDARITANLAEARRKLTRPIAAPAPSALDRIEGSWSFLGESTRLTLAMLLLWTTVACVLLRRANGGAERTPTSAIARRLAWPAGALAALLSATVAADLVRRTTLEAAVVREPTMLRKGNGDGFEPVLGEELPEGTECIVHESRPGWTEVTLGDGTRGWLRDGDLVRVR